MPKCTCIERAKYSILIKLAYHTTLEVDAFISKLKNGNKENQIVISMAVKHRVIEVS